MRISRSTSSSSSSSNQSSISAFCSAALRRKYLNVGPIDSRLVNDEEGLVRGLSLTDLILIGIGASIGAGIFVVTGTAARDAGPGVAISFILAGAACILNALCYAELSSRFPATVGGAYMYSYTAFNELTAFLVFAQLMVDYHIGAASIARSLASYLISFLELFPFLKGHFPSWISGGTQFFNGIVSINILAPILLILLTVILCYGVKESSAVNSFMTATKVLIVIFVILAGSFKVDVSNWSPFVPNGFKAVVTGATVVFFAYVGFDAVANSAEEAKKPQRDLPIGILGSLIVCIILYVAVCLVLTGMIPYSSLGEEAPLAEAFTSKGMKYVSVLISIAAVAGLTTTLLVGLYVQSRLYLGLGRDGLLPSIFAKVHPTRHTPVHSQIWVGCVAAIMGGLFNVHMLSHILSVGTLTGYSVVCACLITLRWRDKQESQVTGRCISTRLEGVICLLAVACCGFSAGLCYRYNASFVLVIVFVFLACLAGAALHFRQVYIDPPGFSCPGVPTVPVVSIFFNIFLFAQAKRNGAQEKKNVAFQAEKDDSDSDNEDMAMIAKNFKKFLKFNKNKFKGNKNNFNNNSNSSKPSSSAMECYECHKKGHMKKDCPERKKNNFKKDKTKRKAFSVTWDDTDSSSSSESESDNEQANVCFMASSDDVPHKKRGKWILDSGCSKHMTGNKEMLSNIIYSNGGAVTFGDNSKGYIIGKGDVSSNGQKWGQPDSFRYNCCFLWMDISIPVLDNYVDQRVDCMINNGLLNEVYEIYKPNADYTLGLRQAIGVREFDEVFKEYISNMETLTSKASHEMNGILNQIIMNTNSEASRPIHVDISGFSDNKLQCLLDEAIEKLKANTRKLARRQIRRLNRLKTYFGWNLHQINATEAFLSNTENTWYATVMEPCVAIVSNFLSGDISNVTTKLNDIRIQSHDSRDLWSQYVCEACGNKILRGAHEWQQHQQGRGHRKRILSLRKKAGNPYL